MPDEQQIGNPLAATSNASNVVVLPSDNPEDEQLKFLDFTQARSHLERQINEWRYENAETELRRKTRKIDIDIESKRQTGEIDEDETLIPIRMIDSNIKREQPSYMNFLINSRRVAVFRCIDDPQQETGAIEEAFTLACTYPEWEKPFHQNLDGTQHHGSDFVEVVFDPDKSDYGNFSIEHVGHDKLMYPQSAINLQYCPRIIRGYDLTHTQLHNNVRKFGFDKEVVDQIMAARKDTSKESETIRIYKLFFKMYLPQYDKNIVHVAWFCLSDGVKDWLKKPEKHYVGIDTMDPLTKQWVPVPMTLYPIFENVYCLTEEQTIFQTKGRGFLDEYKQEAITALWSALVNGTNRASGIYASPAQDDGSGSSLKELEDVKLTKGRILSKPVNFWQPPYPSPLHLKIVQSMDIQNSDETNQVNFAAMNREDSRKTAREISAAQQQQQLLNSVQLVLFSMFLRKVYSFVWKIVQSQALQNKIKFLLIPIQQPMMNPAMGSPMGNGQMQTVWVNDYQTIVKIYDVRSAGDVDVIQRAELEQKMQQDMPLFANTALASTFMLDYVKLRYPDKALRYGQILQQQGDQLQQLKALVGKLSTMFEGALKDDPHLIRTLPMQQRQDLAQTMQEAQQVTGQLGQNGQ